MFNPATHRNDQICLKLDTAKGTGDGLNFCGLQCSAPHLPSSQVSTRNVCFQAVVNFVVFDYPLIISIALKFDMLPLIV